MWLRTVGARHIREGFLPLLRVQKASCWACNHSVHEVLCHKCGKVQPVEKNANYFKVLGQDEKFTLNRSHLQKKFRDLQKVLHPDKFANCSEEEKSYSADQSALVNQAYQVLLKPIQRAEYLLKINGTTLKEVKLPQKFLLEMMDLNEQIDDADDEAKEKLLEEIITRQENAMEELQESFTNQATAQACEILAKIKYLDNLVNRIKELQLK